MVDLEAILGWIWRGFGEDFLIIWLDFHGILDDWPLTRKIWAKIVLETAFHSKCDLL